MNFSMIAWPATPNASFASFWSSSRKSINFWFVGLKFSRWNLCFAVAIDWSFTFYLQNTDRFPPRFSLLEMLMFLNNFSASPRMRDWKQFFLSSVSRLWIFKFVWNTSSSSLFFSDFAVEGRHCCREGFWQFWKFVDVVVKVGRIAVARQLLKGQQNLVRFNCRGGVLAARFWLTCGARFPCFCRRSSRRTVGNLFLNSSHHVRGRMWESNCWSDGQRTPLRVGDHSRKGLQLVLVFPGYCFGMFPERFRRVSASVGSSEIGPTWTDHPNYLTLFY